MTNSILRTWVKGCRQRAGLLRMKRLRMLGKARMNLLGGMNNGEKRVEKLPVEQANTFLTELIEKGTPASVVRYGLFELRAFHQQSVGGNVKDSWLRKSLSFNAGVFPISDDEFARFADAYAEASSKADVLGLSLYRHGLWKEEQWAFQKFCPKSQLIDLHDLEFIPQKAPWTRSLVGKRVVIVSPLVDSIPQQYAKRELLFPHNQALPEFASLRVVKAVQSAAGAKPPFASWTEALDWMKREMAKEPFDVALIGAGAYGLPLAAHAKSLGAIGIQMGGITQLLFGIKGARWDKKRLEYFNEHWIRPLDSEKPPQAKGVEGGCYW